MTNAVNIAQSGSNNQTMRNRIINGAMVIDQRNAGASVTGNGFPVDRFQIPVSQSSKLTAQQNAGSVTPPAGFTNYLGVTSSSAYSVLASDYFLIYQGIEGFNTADLAWGTANAQPVTLSFWARSSLTGTFGGSLRNAAAVRAYPFSYTISAANTWEYKTITIAGDTTGTWLTSNSAGICLYFDLGSGTNLRGTAGVWNSNGNVGVTGSVSVVGTNGATFYITGVQLEEGTAASPFENRLYGTELALCQRYYCQSTNLVAANALYNSSDCIYMSSWNYTGGNWIGQPQPYPVSMRTTPTISLFTAAPASSVSAGNVSHYQTTWVVAGAEPHNSTNERYLTFANTGTTGVTGNCLIQFNYTASAEL
jgi:hypothetical protein